MYGLQVYITPEDILNKLCDEDKERFDQCIFTDVIREPDGSITIDCIVFNDPDLYIRNGKHRQKYCDGNLSVNTLSLEPKR